MLDWPYEMHYSCCMLTKRCCVCSGGKGGGSLTASAELPPNLSTNFKPPSFTSYFDLDSIESIKFTVGLYVVPKVVVNLYSGAVQGELSISIGPELSTSFDVADVFNGQVCDILEDVDLSLVLSGDVEVGTAFDDSLKAKTNLFEESLPILNVGGVECPNTGTCSGDEFFDGMAGEFSDMFNNEIFLAQGASPNDPWLPSTGKHATF